MEGIAVIVLVKTVETITRQYEVHVDDRTTAENAFSKVYDTNEDMSGWIECDFTAIETLSEIATVDSKVLWTVPIA
jgi:hypothetical protein